MEQNNALIEAQIDKESFYEQFEVKKWLDGKKGSTKIVYLSALRSYTQYTGLSPKQLIDSAEEDRKKSPRLRGAERAQGEGRGRREVSFIIMFFNGVGSLV